MNNDFNNNNNNQENQENQNSQNNQTGSYEFNSRENQTGNNQSANSGNMNNQSGQGFYGYNNQSSYNGQNGYGNNMGQGYHISQGPNGEYFYSYNNSGSTNNVNNNPPKKKKGGASKAVIAFLLVIVLAVGIVGGVFIAGKIQGIVESGETEKEGVDTIIEDETGKTEEETRADAVIIKSETASDKIYTSISEVVDKVQNSVVEITTETVTTSSYYGQYVQSGAGSGVVITDNGYIITCAHVVEGATTITVKFPDGESYVAEVIGEDSVTDIAVLKIEGEEKFEYATIGKSANLVVGADVVVIGNPLGSLGGTVTNGIISALDRKVTIDGQAYNLLQTNAAINPGNSGGGMFNMMGELIGVVNAKSSGTGIEGLAFAIPIDDAIDVAEQLIENGYISGRPALGINVAYISSTSDLYKYYNSDYAALVNYVTTTGIYFIQYATDMGQVEGDLKFGDRIVALDGVQVSTQAELTAVLLEHEVGEEVILTVARITNLKSQRAEYVEVPITLVEKKSN